MKNRIASCSGGGLSGAGYRVGFRCLLAIVLAMVFPAHAAQPVIRAGVLKFGTVNWELNVVRQHGLDTREGVRLQVVPMAGKLASSVALQSGAVDVIVSDWTWVARQRAVGKRYAFVPYSMAVGGLMVRSELHARTLQDLAGKRLGVAGGPADKSWLLLRAYAKRHLGHDLKEVVKPVFGAPPLLNQLVLRGELDGAITFWHYGARLQAAGLKPLITMPEVLRGLGVKDPLPLVGWVFDEQWASKHAKTLRAFLRASYAAKHILAESDDEWQRIRPLTKAENDATLIALRDTFRAGIPRRFGAAEIDAASRVYALLTELNPELKTQGGTTLDRATFWNGFKVPTWGQ